MSEIGKALGRRRMERDVLEEILEVLQHLHETSTAAAARHLHRAVNGVLAVETVILGSTGVYSRTFGTAIGSVVVANPGAHTVTVVAGPAQADSAPTCGIGVSVVPAGAFLAIPIGSPTVTLYGTAGDSVGLQVFVDLAPYGSSR